MRRLNGWLHAGLGMAIGTCLVAGCIPAPNRARLPGQSGQEGIVRSALPPGLGSAANIAGRVPGVPNVMAPPLQAPSVISNNGGNVLKGSVRAPATIISHNGGNIVSNNGGGIVSNNGGGIISHNGGNLQIAQLPLAFTTVRVMDAAGQPVKDSQGRELVTKTDANGNYSFPVEVKGRNLVIEADVERQNGKLKSLLPKEGVKAGGSLDVDMTSTLTLAYILDQYVKGDLNTFERLPKDIEAKARVVTEAAIIEKQIALPTSLDDGAIVAKVDEVRKAEPKVDQVFEEIKRLLVIAGITNEGDGLLGTSVAVGSIGGAAADREGNIFVFSQSMHTLWKLTPDGILHTVVPKGAWGYAEDTTAFFTPGYTSGLLVLEDGGLILADTYHNRVVQVSTARQVTVLAGTGIAAFSGDGNDAKVAQLNRPSGLTLGPDGALYISDTENHRVRKIDRSGKIQTVLGNGTPSYSGDGGSALTSGLNRPQGLALSQDGALYIADYQNSRVRMLKDGTVTSVGDPSIETIHPIAIAIDKDYDVLCVSHRSGQVVKISGAGSQVIYDPISARRSGLQESLDFPRVICLIDDKIYVDDDSSRFGLLQSDGHYRRLIGADRLDLNLSAQFVNAYQMTIDNAGSIFVADIGAQKVLQINSDGLFQPIAGNGGDASAQTSASPTEVGIGMVAGITIDNDGAVLFSTIGNFTAVRKIDFDGGLKNIVGTGKVDYLKPPIGPALAVDLPNVFDLVQLPDGTIVFSAPEHNYLLKLTTQGDVEQVIKPNPLLPVHPLGFPTCLAKDHLGNVGFVELTSQKVSKVIDGRLTTHLGNASVSKYFDLSDVKAMAFDKYGNTYLASSNKVVCVDEEGTCQLIAGVGSKLLNGTTRDQGIQQVRDIEVSPEGDLYILEAQQLKRVTAAHLDALY